MSQTQGPSFFLLSLSIRSPEGSFKGLALLYVSSTVCPEFLTGPQQELKADITVPNFR